MKSHFLGENQTGVILSIKWFSPYTNPPIGKARILWACSIPWPCNFNERKLFLKVPDGYVCTYSFFDLKPRKTWNPERKAKERLRRMRQRFFKKSPLFADQFILAKINSKPDYYDPIAIAKADIIYNAKIMELEKEIMAQFINNCSGMEINKPKIIVLCGSSKFVDIMAVTEWLIERDELAITMGLNLLPQWYPDCPADHLAEHEGCAEAMDELHLRKIDLANEIFVVDWNGYIGKSTSNEIKYAKKTGKHIRYFSKDIIGKNVCELIIKASSEPLDDIWTNKDESAEIEREIVENIRR